MNITDIDKQKCTGCAECKNRCPAKCIQMVADEAGFFYPVINTEDCINCELCYRTCQVVKRTTQSLPQQVYAVQRKSLDKLQKSASGGMGALLSEYFIKTEGIVYGCIFDEELIVKHVRIEKESDLSKLYGSKYVQSDMGNIYLQLKKDCDDNKSVIFLGTPCQIAAIKNFMDKDYSNLLLVDIICHGVPSQKLFDNYLKWKERKIGEKILSYNFRDKSIWKWGTSYKADTNTKTIFGRATMDPYYSAFIYGETYRESCYQCPYAVCDRCGDITIGDFWGFESLSIKADFNWEEGVSAVLINTEQGNKYFERVKDELHYVVSKLELVKLQNDNLYHPAYRPAVRNIFYKNVSRYGFSWVNIQMYKTKRYYINYVKSLIPLKLKKKIKIILKRI